MTTTLVGTMSIGQALPEVNAAMAVFISGIQPQFDGVIEAQGRILLSPPSLSANLATAQQLVTELEAAIALPIPPVEIDFQAAALAALLASLQAQLAAVATLRAQLGASISAYAITGTAGEVSPGEQLPPGVASSAPAGAIALVATTPEARAALGAFVGGAAL